MFCRKVIRDSVRGISELITPTVESLGVKKAADDFL